MEWYNISSSCNLSSIPTISAVMRGGLGGIAALVRSGCEKALAQSS